MDDQKTIILPYGNPIPFEILEELEDLINNDARETALHDFLERNLEVFPGIDPANVFSKKRIEFPDGRIAIPDLIVLPKGKHLFDIIELKGANQPVVRGDREGISPSRARSYTAFVHRAIRQLRVYSSLFEDRANREYVKQKLGIDIYRPRLTLIIGKAHYFIDELERRDLERDHPGIELITWDDLLSEAKKRVFCRLVIPVSKNIPSYPNIVLRNSEQGSDFTHLAVVYGNDQYGVAVFSQQKLRDISSDETTKKWLRLSPEEAGYKKRPGFIGPLHSQRRCRRCGSTNVENIYVRIGFQGEENHYLDCRDCGFSQLLGVEYP